MEENGFVVKEKNYVSKMRDNPWIFSTIVLGVVLVFLVVISNTGAGISGNVISEDSAGQAVLEFAQTQVDGSVEVLSVEKDGAIYKVLLDVDGQALPVFVTLDGKYGSTGVFSLMEEEIETPSSTTQPSTEVVKSDKPTVELFVMSHCPFGTQAEKGIIPVVETLGDKIDFELKFVNYAMHGETEVVEQTYQYCIQEEHSEKLIPYLKAFLEEGNRANALAKVGLSESDLQSCFDSADTEFDIMENLNDKSSWLNGRFPKFLIDEQANVQYGVRGSPTLVINGQQVSSARDSASMLSVICSAFNNVPSECSTQLSSTTPSSGFGYDSASAGSGSAQCA